MLNSNPTGWPPVTICLPERRTGFARDKSKWAAMSGSAGSHFENSLPELSSLGVHQAQEFPQGVALMQTAF